MDGGKGMGIGCRPMADDSGKKIVNLGDRRKGDLSTEWRGTVVSVTRLESDRLVYVWHHELGIADESYRVSPGVIAAAGRDEISPNDQIVFHIGLEPDMPIEVAVLHCPRITRLRFT